MVVTDATVFLRGTSTAVPVYHLLRFLDALTLGLLILVTIGIWKISLNVRLQTAAGVVVASWLFYVGLGFVWLS
jgi:predicted TIM-barrel enzyme